MMMMMMMMMMISVISTREMKNLSSLLFI